ncbi:MAG: flagellar biosynthesis protein FlhB [Planctomycetaceae bacterium]|nr:flagellar biosynthesis protein FlhB [Planctomycetales bacterium]MCB9924797.1 flagellar biosynthesis protein FlhB [Planctomycetaceae bacterium]
MAEQFGDKQHEATDHRRQQAREQGQVAKSQDLASAALLLAAVGGLMLWGDNVTNLLANLMRSHLSGDVQLQLDRDTFTTHSYDTLMAVGMAMLPLLGLLAFVAIAANVGQVGFLFLPDKLAVDINRLNPLQGLTRIFSIANAAKLGFGIFKIVIVAAIAGWSVWGELDQILRLGGLEVGEIAAYIFKISLGTCFKIGLALFVLAIIDYVFQRWKQEQDLRMTTQEVREEMKTMQGDPQIQARRRAVQRQLVLNRIGSSVPKADVVVTNPTELAIAIRYDHETMDAPVVQAKGAGVVAQRIRRIALENNIPVVERKELARALYKHVEIGKPVPSGQYAAMAEVLRYVYQLKGKKLPTAVKAG